MKKISLTLLLATALLQAAPYTKDDRVKDMQTMADAMTKIETGFFYNNKDIVNEGAMTLIDTINRVEPPIEDENTKDPLVKMMNRKVEVTNKIVKYINKKTRVMLERYKSGDPRQATQAYNKIMQKCMECHYKIRKW